MAKLDMDKLVEDMTDAAKKVFSDKEWASIDTEAKKAIADLGQCIIDIEHQKNQGLITEENAKLLIEMQKNAIQSVFLQIKGIQLIGCQKAVNAALGVVASAVNAAIGWPLL